MTHHIISEEADTPQEAWIKFFLEVSKRDINWKRKVLWRHLPELVHNVNFDDNSKDTYKVRARFSVIHG